MEISRPCLLTIYPTVLSRAVMHSMGEKLTLGAALGWLTCRCNIGRHNCMLLAGRSSHADGHAHPTVYTVATHSS